MFVMTTRSTICAVALSLTTIQLHRKCVNFVSFANIAKGMVNKYFIFWMQKYLWKFMKLGICCTTTYCVNCKYADACELKCRWFDHCQWPTFDKNSYFKHVHFCVIFKEDYGINMYLKGMLLVLSDRAH
jgi:hypothetical protein